MEILIGIVVMALFVGFVMWKNRGREKPPTDWEGEQWWAEREARNREGPSIRSSSEAGKSGDREDSRDNDDGDGGD